MSRKIIHIDMDCFYAAVEIRDAPHLSAMPVAVGGPSHERGVICSANYEARKWGVRSAMATRRAMHLCPNLVLLPVNMSKYRAVSEMIHRIFARYTDKIEPLSLDEAYLEVTGSLHHHGSASLIAIAIRADIERECGVTASAGVSVNKFLAKVASGWNKPNGQWVIPPHQVAEFVATLPVENIWGVGQKTAAKLHALNLKTCGDIQAWSQLQLVQQFGSFGAELFQFSRGIDERAVVADGESKSVSAENTFTQDLPDLDSCIQALPEIYARLLKRLQSHDSQVIKKQFVKLKFHDFTQTTLERGSWQPDLALFIQQLTAAFARKHKPVRLIGLGVDFAEPSPQLSLF